MQGSDPIGGRWGPLQEKNIVWVSRRSGPARPTRPSDPIMGLRFIHKCRNVTDLCFDLILPDFRLAENHRFCDAGVSYRSSFPHSTRNSQLVPFPHHHHAVFFNFHSSLASLWLQKGMASLHLLLANEEKVMVICFWFQQIRYTKVD